MRAPRIVIAASASGAGKTTASVALIAALRARGLKVAPFKCGPDYLDPTYHSRAAGRRSHNLDMWMMGRRGVLETFARNAGNSDIAIIEGMMGLFDSAAPDSDEGSTAELAKCLEAPVLLVTDASGIARTIGALAQGFAHYDPDLKIAAMICNRIGGRGHLDLLRQSGPEIPIVGGFPEAAGASFSERHLGLFGADAVNLPATLIGRWGKLAEEWLELDEVIRLARTAPELPAPPVHVAAAASPQCRIGIALDEAFHFYYDANLALLENAGAELVFFSPLHDQNLPQVGGLCFGGGYPEAVARELSRNSTMLQQVRDFAELDRPIYAECGGLMYLSEGIRTLDDATYPMAGLIPGIAVMRDSVQALGYVEVETRAPAFLGPQGTRWRGHQFRYSVLEPQPPSGIQRLYRVAPRWGGELFDEGYCRNNVVASYVHAHWASNPSIANNFVTACMRGARPTQVRASTLS